MVYAALDGWRRHMVQMGGDLLGAAIDLAHVLRGRIEQIPDIEVLDSELLGVEASHDLDRMQILMDVSATGLSGYQAADWLRENCHLDVALSDHRRILATLSFADNAETTDSLVEGLTAWRRAATDGERPPKIKSPSPEELQLETVQLPGCIFGPTEMVSATQASGRIAAEQITPYPPGIPAVVPGERLNDAVIDYLQTGLNAGMTLPDPADPTLEKLRVVA